MATVGETTLHDPPALNLHPEKVVHADEAGDEDDLGQVTLINPPALDVNPTRVVHAPYSED